ncbi:MAG: H-X9-DG-CTERM domain-containing protein [Planctomycetota bacterium]
MPSSLDALAEAMPLDRERLICPNDRARGPMTGSIVIGANCSYLVFLDRGALGDPGMMIGSCVPHLHEGDGANVLFGDGSIRWEQDRVFTSMLVGDPELER